MDDLFSSFLSFLSFLPSLPSLSLSLLSSFFVLYFFPFFLILKLCLNESVKSQSQLKGRRLNQTGRQAPVIASCVTKGGKNTTRGTVM